MFIIWIILIVGAIYFLRQQEQRGTSYSEQAKYQAVSSRDALDILRERYARGEIDSEEYHRLKQDLMS